MSIRSCICVDKTYPPPQEWVYPEWKEGNEDCLSLFQRNGYFVVRNFITAEEIEATKEAVSDIVRKWFLNLKEQNIDGKDWEQIANR